jgi:hypothetical protein
VTGEEKDAGDQTAPARLQDASLGIGKAGEIGAGKRIETPVDGLVAGVPVGGDGAERRRPLIGQAGLCGARIAQEGLAGRRVGKGAVGGQEGLRFPGGKGVTANGVGQPHLIGAWEGGDGEGGGKGEAASIETDCQFGDKTSGQRQPALDPGLLAAEELGDRGQGEAVFVRERCDDAGLVHGAEGLAGGVGSEEPRLGGRAGDGLDEDGDFAEPFANPEGQSLEAVEDLEGAVGGGGDANGERREIGLTVGPRAPQRRPGGPEPVGRDGEDGIHRAASSTGRIWKSG